MSEIWRHMAFDFRRYGWLAAIGLLIVSLTPYWGLGLLALLVIPLMVLNHKTAGSQAWWLVRPVNRTRLWLAKSLEILILCLGAVAVMSVEPVLQGIHPGFVAWCKMEEFPLLIAACGLSAVIASLSPDLRRYFLVLPSVLIAAACLAAVWVQLAGFVADRNPGEEILRWFPTEPQKYFAVWLLIALFSAAGLFAAFWVHVRNRRLTRTIPLAVISILAPIYLGNVVSLLPFFLVILLLEGRLEHREIRPISGHISLLKTDLVAEEVNRPPGEFSWRVRLPFEIHLDEELPPNVYFEAHEGFRFSSLAGPNPVKGRAPQKPFGRWHFNQQAAMVRAAGVEPVNPVYSGREIWALFDFPYGADSGDWMDRPMALTGALNCRGEIIRTEFVGALKLEKGTTLIDRGERYRISFVTTLKDQEGLAITSETLLEPRSGLNPARRWGGGRGRNAFVLWDSLTSETHFAERGIRLETQPDGDLQFVSGFPSLRDRKFSASRLGDLKILVVRKVPIETRMIEVKPATFTFRMLE